MRVAITAASLALSACAAHTQASSALSNSLEAMIGQSVEAAVARLGPPSATESVGSDRVYGWGHAVSRTELLHPLPGFIDAANSQGGVFPPPRTTIRDSCVIRIVVGADGLIREWDYQNNERGCRSYATPLAGHTRPTG